MTVIYNTAKIKNTTNTVVKIAVEKIAAVKTNIVNTNVVKTELREILKTDGFIFSEDK